jgi:hypothetical protein
MLKTHRFPIAFVGLSLLFGTIFYGNSGVMSYSPLVSPFGIASNIIDSDTGAGGGILPKCDSRLVTKELLSLMNDTPQARRGGFEAKRVFSSEEVAVSVFNLEVKAVFSEYLKQLPAINEKDKSQLFIDFMDGPFAHSRIKPETKKLFDDFLNDYANQIQRKCSLQVATNAGEKTVNLEITWADEKSKRPKFNASWR